MGRQDHSCSCKVTEFESHSCWNRRKSSWCQTWEGRDDVALLYWSPLHPNHAVIQRGVLPRYHNAHCFMSRYAIGISIMCIAANFLSRMLKLARPFSVKRSWNAVSDFDIMFLKVSLWRLQVFSTKKSDICKNIIPPSFSLNLKEFPLKVKAHCYSDSYTHPIRAKKEQLVFN